MNKQIPCRSIKDILTSALSGIVPPEKSSVNSISPENSTINPQEAIPESYAFVSDSDQFLRRNIPDPYSYAYEIETLLRCNNSPLGISLEKYKTQLMEKER